eukprot:CAMPEP_0119340904 /NCGR_PEP_ID=MMETSP1333-20130426/101251_1 /TAXON_ID=418940 /ORGANISM="Scyphosphaera apsteinii, Strain RCC1455" /LENGTH=40 /DNA_ID= /DNA_START= /DNA_END= /DNA_ORIENTATION=
MAGACNGSGFFGQAVGVCVELLGADGLITRLALVANVGVA